MRLVNINFIDVEKHEYYVAKPIYSSGALLLRNDVKLTTSFIDQLKAKDINNIYVKDELSEGIEINELIGHDELREARDNVKSQFESVKQGKDFNRAMNMVNNTVGDLLDIMVTNKDVGFNISNLRSMDDYLYEHCVNVSISCMYMAVLMNYNKKDIMDIGVGGMLHDIGKIFIDNSILDKPDKLNDEEMKEMQKHPELGYRLIADNHGNNISSTSKQVIFQHHERWDGKGYPNGLMGPKIYKMARICAIADVFDALTGNKIYKQSIPTYQAAEYMYSLSEKYFDPYMVKVFLSKVVKFKEGSLVELSDSTKGIVYSQNNQVLDRPIIKILVEKNGKMLGNRNRYIDLMEDKTVFIKGLLQGDLKH